ncbi:hypothetical protein [Paludisphaera borealis]|uniref:Yip1 domain-containing protein n=1 Tax=Paludisphaera borealis TaxID=1387353 RepID=A0A1U7CXF0_9BACT|nr:hypothetical protein [Paludisphaera borealis]APW63630.1 hypothetical protein BSF38_05204 [Paludisphaera borealis]
MDLAPPRESTGGRSTAELRFGAILCVWMVLILALNGARWIAGFRPVLLAVAVERGVQRIEADGKGETGDDLVRKAIRTQRDSLPFWTVVFVFGDFVIEPFALVLRAVCVAIGFTAIAAMTGRPLQFERALSDSAWIQGFWVLGLAVRVGLLVVLRRGEDDLDTSLGLLLPPGTYPAATWLMLRECDVFALLGWVSLATSGWRRGDANLAAAVVLCSGLGFFEMSLRTAVGLVLGSAMRLSLIAS